MWNFLQTVGSSLLGMLLPMASGIKAIGRGLRWALHFIILGLILVGLYFLNGLLKIHEQIPNPTWARPIWLPIFFLLLYFAGWIAWWLWKLLSSDAEASHFPDIDEAWDEGVRALGQAGVQLRGQSAVPLFLVLGRPEAAEEHLFNAAQLNLLVKQSPPGARAPVHVYASRDAVYVTCPGASLLGRQAVLLALEEFPDQDSPAAGDNFDPSQSMGATLRPGEKEKGIKMVLRRGGAMTARDKRAIRREAGLPLPDLAPREWDLLTARLGHLARLIVRDRYPLCPLNGIMVLVPLGGSDTESDTQRTAETCYRDLSTVRRVLKVLCPVYGLICDLETLPGFLEFLQGQEKRDRMRRLGQRFPFAPDLSAEAYFDKIRQAVEYMSSSLLREWVYRLFRLEVPDKEDKAAAVNRNNHLFLMLEEMRNRGKWLGRILSNGVARDTMGLFGGCYLSGTGANKEREQGFAAGVFRRLVESQNYVSWTQQAQTDDAKNHRLATIGYTLLGVAVAVLAGLAAMKFLFPRGRR